MEKISCSTADLAVENAKKLIGLFPECEGERGTVDLDKLRQVLSSSVVEGNVERYEFTWPGKRKAMAAASAATTKTLRPCVEESVGKDGTKGGFDSENLYIEGDNLEVLKLLQCNYAGKVKMIYIDPPYNTGHDFVYRDRFSLTDKELAQEGGAFDEDGNRFEKNDSAEARYHSNWCSMMYPRLKLAKNLLRDDGVLFMSIDDNEVVNARKLCDEVFGEANFVAQLVWERAYAPKNDARFISNSHDYVLMIARDIFSFVIGRLPRTDEANARYRNLDDDPRGDWKPSDMSVKTYNAECDYPITLPSGRIVEPPTGRCWSLSKKAFLERLEDNRIWFGADGNSVPCIKRFLSELKFDGMAPTSIMFYKDVGHSQEGAKEVTALLEAGAFDGPKPMRLLYRLLILAKTSPDSLVLDFFSGSATTAHAVMKLNAEDGGNRKFIMVQLPEQCAEDSEAAKAGYKNICEIGKERIRRAGEKIREELFQRRGAVKQSSQSKEASLFDEDSLRLSTSASSALKNTECNNLDTGFRVLKLDSSSLNDTSATVGETVQEFANFNRIKSDRSPEDLLFQILLETRIPLSEPIAKVKVGENEVFLVGLDELESDGLSEGEGVPLVACLDQKAKLDNEFFIELAKLKPEIAFFRDDAFDADSARINVEQIFKQNSANTVIKVI